MKDCCTKNAFTFNNTIYEQIDGVSVGPCLASTLANITMSELEIKIVYSFFKDGLLKLYILYPDDILALIKESDINKVLSKLNTFHTCLNFIVDESDDIIHYLDLNY